MSSSSQGKELDVDRDLNIANWSMNGINDEWIGAQSEVARIIDIIEVTIWIGSVIRPLNMLIRNVQRSGIDILIPIISMHDRQNVSTANSIESESNTWSRASGVQWCSCNVAALGGIAAGFAPGSGFPIEAHVGEGGVGAAVVEEVCDGKGLFFDLHLTGFEVGVFLGCDRGRGEPGGKGEEWEKDGGELHFG
ncbi:hypothetical protein TWF173_003904 [Orbilia oligospora]|nr:hypothetical protein TWF173_003904 [Orbilia oligospora]